MADWDPKVNEIFAQAIEQSGAAGREAYLKETCADNADLRRRVEALLAAHAEAGRFLEPEKTAMGCQTIDSDPATAPDDAPDPAYTTENDESPGQPNASHLVATADYHHKTDAGTVIAGRYRVQEKIGEGGMGEVWVAKQTEPVKRKVALKLIKPGMDSRAVIARFEQERQALAMMDHPNIARVLDGGLCPNGQPYFVMELVNGLPLTRFCDEAKLTPRERLELFVPICQAVQHAHQKGIVHRDLKPANILVTLIDGKPVPKVIDFGVAKATGGKLTDDTMSTAFGAVVGTMEYMSPEQAGLSGVDIDTRSDIYSLGVILYELLTGFKPIDGKRLKNAALPEMVRIIQEEEPPKPSTRLSTDESLPSMAALRHIEPRKLMDMLRGELDWVVMKCLEKNRERRYGTANGLARDIQRYLADEPVEARPPSTGYRLSKFLKRNKGPVIAAGLVLSVLLMGVMGTTWGLFEAKRQEREAKRQEREAKRQEQVALNEASEKEKARQAAAARAEGERLAKLDAQAQKEQCSKRLTQVEKSNEILTSVFADLNINSVREGDDPLEAVLASRLLKAAGELEGEAIGEPLVTAKLQSHLGMSLLSLGYATEAVPLFFKARETYAAELGPKDQVTLRSMYGLAKAYEEVGRLDLAVPLFQQTFELTKATLGPDHRETLTSMDFLAGSYGLSGKLDLAIPLYELTLKLIKANLESDDGLLLSSMNNLALAYIKTGKVDLAVPLLENVLKLRKSTSGLDHPQTLTSMINLAAAYSKSGKLDLALPLLEQSLKLHKARLGAEHPRTLNASFHLAFLYDAARKRDLALPLFAETLKLQKVHGGESPETLASMKKAALGFRPGGGPEPGLSLSEETLKFQKDNLGPEHPDTLLSMDRLARVYQAAGKRTVLPLFEQTLRLKKARLGPDHPSTLISMNNLALAYHTAGKRDLALPFFEETLRRQKARPDREPSRTLIYLANLAMAYQTAGRGEMAFPLWEESLKLMKANLGSEYPDTLILTKNLASSYQNAGRIREALPLLVAQSSANPRDTELSLKVAALQAWFGQDKELAATRQRILAFNAVTKDAQRAERSAKACSIRPAADKKDLEATLILSRRSVELGKTDAYLPFFQMAHGMAEYRSGNFAAADLALLAAMKGGKGYSKIMGISQLYLAMSLFKQGKQAEARKQMISAWATMTPLPADAENPLAGDADHDQLIIWLAYKEARSMIKVEQSLVELLEKLRDEEVKQLGANHPSTLATTYNLAQAYLNNGRTREAIPLLAAHSSANPKETWPALRVAVLQAWFGEDNELATTGQRILAFTKGTNDASTAEQAAKACCIRPIGDKAQREAALLLARRGVELGKTNPWLAYFQMTLGMAEYRSGNFAAAEKPLLAAAKLAKSDRRVTSTSAFYQAMSLFKQRKQDEARTLLATASATMKPLPANDENPLDGNTEAEPENDLVVWMAFKEAKALIGFDAKPAPAAKLEKMP